MAGDAQALLLPSPSPCLLRTTYDWNSTVTSKGTNLLMFAALIRFRSKEEMRVKLLERPPTLPPPSPPRRGRAVCGVTNRTSAQRRCVINEGLGRERGGGT
jgi:hypothetical protein